MKVSAAVRGLAAGLAGVVAMTAAEKLEQRFTRRPNSFVPGHTMERLMRLPAKPDEERLWMNWAMHWGQGVLLGAVRGLMAERGVRGPVGYFAFMNLRLLNDQTLENATGSSPAPRTYRSPASAGRRGSPAKVRRAWRPSRQTSRKPRKAEPPAVTGPTGARTFGKASIDVPRSYRAAAQSPGRGSERPGYARGWDARPCPAA